MYSLPAMVTFGIIACSMPEVFADYPQRHLLATNWALCFRKIYVYHIIFLFVWDQIMNAKIRIFSVSAKFSSIFRNRYVRYSRASVIILWLAVLAMPVAIFSTTLLYIVGPAVLLALLFFNLTFIALGSSYIPTEYSIICMFRKHFENILPFFEIIFVLLQAYLLILLKFRMWFKYGLKAQKLLAQGIALGYYGRKPVAL